MDPSSAEASVTLPNRLTELPRLADFVTAFAETRRLSGELAFTLNLVVEELVANVISHGYEDEREDTIRVSLACEGETVRVEIEDQAGPFNPLEAPEARTDAPLEERDLGGLGVHLVRSLMDRIEYIRKSDGNLVVLIKQMGAAD